MTAGEPPLPPPGDRVDEAVPVYDPQQDSFARLRLRASRLLAQAEQVEAVDDNAQRLLQETRLLQTELAMQQDELRESQARLEALRSHYFQLFQSAPIAYCRLSPTLDALETNTAARALLGIDEAHPGVIPFFTLVPPAHQPAWRTLLAAGKGQLTTTLQGADGQLWADVRLVETPYDQGGYLVAIVDISRLRRAQQNQREAEERYAAVVDRMVEGLVVIEPTSGLIVDHNAAFARLLGRPGVRLVGAPHDDLLLPTLRPVLAAALRQPDIRDLVRVHYRRLDATEVITEVCAGWRDVHGGTNIFYVVRDVSEAVRAEERRRALELRLAEGQKLEALGQLAAGVAHDINNVLAVVLAATEEAPTEATLSELRAVALRGRDLTERLLALSRKQPLRTAPFDLLEVVGEVVAVAQRTFPRTAAVTLVRPEGSWILEGDAGQWHRSGDARRLGRRPHGRDPLPLARAAGGHDVRAGRQRSLVPLRARRRSGQAVSGLRAARRRASGARPAPRAGPHRVRRVRRSGRGVPQAPAATPGSGRIRAPDG